jgi:hypothetical protein
MDRLLTAFVEAIMGIVFGTIGLAMELPVVGVLLALAIGAQFVAAGVFAWLAMAGLGLIALAFAKRMSTSVEGGRIVQFAALQVVGAIIYGVVLGFGGQVGFAFVVTLVWIGATIAITLFVPDGDAS